MKYRCPVCKKTLEVKEHKSQYFPFCSERCRLIDLGKWLDAKYIITSRPQDKTGSDWEDG